MKKVPSTPAPTPPPPSMSAMWNSMPRRRKPDKVVQSVTREEIDRYWRTKRMIEEEHLLAAQKAAARIRAKSLKEEDYRRFEESVTAILEGDKSREEAAGGGVADSGKEIRIGIKDWWTKSKYAYLNQPAVRSMGEHSAANTTRSTSTYVQQMAFHCHLSPTLTSSMFGVSVHHKILNDL